MAYLEAQEFFHRPLPKKKKRLKHFTTHSELFRPAHRDRSTAMIQCSPGGSLSNGNVGEDGLVFRTYAQWYTTEYEPPKRNVRVPSAHARACVFETHGCCHELAWKCLRRCIRAQVCRLDITKGALWRTHNDGAEGRILIELCLPIDVIPRNYFGLMHRRRLNASC